MKKLFYHVVTLPRWFALPAALASLSLGWLLGESGKIIYFLSVILLGTLLMWNTHSGNSAFDYTLTGFDKGKEHERSKRKLYTGSQSVIASGLLSEREVWINYFATLFACLVLTFYLSLIFPAIWLPVILILLCSPWYSYAKKLYHCEIPLGLGFGPFAVMLGNSVSQSPDLLKAFLAGIPFMIMWGFVAEAVDQFIDADVNWKRGLRNIGALIWRYNIPLSPALLFLVFISYLAQFFIISLGILSAFTLLSLIALPGLLTSARILGKGVEIKKGIILGLLSIFLFGALITAGQSI